MALTWGTLIGGTAILFGVPLAVILLNHRKRNAGWWLLLGAVALMIVGNAVEKILTGYSPMFG